MTASAPIHLAGERLLLDPSGALFWPREGVLAVAHLHFGMPGTPHAGQRWARPPGRGSSPLEQLAAVLRRYRPHRVVVLGDIFRIPREMARFPPAERARLASMALNVPFVWIVASRQAAPNPEIPGETAPSWHCPPLTFRHAPTTDGRGELAAHLQPLATSAARGGPVADACFIADAARVILPAFGGFASGLEAPDPAIFSFFPRGARVFLLGHDRLRSFAVAGRRRVPVTAT